MMNKTYFYKLTEHCLTIHNSFDYPKCAMRGFLAEVRATPEGQESAVFTRTLFSLKMEWICHNFLYAIGYKRDETRSVDLDCPCDRPEWQYIVCGLLCWVFVW